MGWLEDFHNVVTSNRQAIGGAAGALSAGKGFGAGGQAFAQGQALDQQRAAAMQHQAQKQAQLDQQNAARQGILQGGGDWINSIPEGIRNYAGTKPEFFDNMLASHMQNQLGGNPSELVVNAPIKRFNPETNQLEYGFPTYDRDNNEVDFKTIGEAQYDSLEAKTAAAIATAGGKKVAETDIERDNIAIDAGYKAHAALPDLKRSVELIEKLRTGGAAADLHAAQNYLGTGSADMGELNNLLSQSVLEGLAAFTGAISEGEREFIVQMNANIGKGGSINKRQLARLIRTAENAVAKSKRVIQRRGGDNMQSMLDEFNQLGGSAMPEGLQTNPNRKMAYDANGNQVPVIKVNGQWVRE